MAPWRGERERPNGADQMCHELAMCTWRCPALHQNGSSRVRYIGAVHMQDVQKRTSKWLVVSAPPRRRYTVVAAQTHSTCHWTCLCFPVNSNPWSPAHNLIV